MKFRLLTILAFAIALALPVVALGTFATELRYNPPKIKIVDRLKHGTPEDLTITREGPDIHIVNGPGMLADPGCTFDVDGHTCPLTGITSLVAVLNGKNDIVRIDLPQTGFVKQVVNAGGGADELYGGRGKQILKGHTGNDTLRGGEGPDLLIGGRGHDTCLGGPGDDTIRSCE